MAVIDELKILVTAEVEKAIADLDKTKKATDDAEKSAGKLGTSFSTMRDLMQGPIAAGEKIVGAMQSIAKFGKELYDSYATMERGLLTFKTAAAGAGISSEAQKRLRDFADQLQKTTIFEGDQTVAIMGNLAAMGKSEQQIKDLIRVAADYASGAGISLDTAVMQLNATLQGSARGLAMQNAAVKGLSESELKAGKAIEIVGKQYSGQAAVIGASAFGLSERIKNLQGDYKELAGAVVAEKTKPLLEAVFKTAQSRLDAQQNMMDRLQVMMGTINDPKEIKAIMERSVAEIKAIEDYYRQFGGYGNSMMQTLTNQMRADLDKIEKIMKSKPVSSLTPNWMQVGADVSGSQFITGGMTKIESLIPKTKELTEAQKELGRVTEQYAVAGFNSLAEAFANGEDPARAFMKTMLNMIGEAIMAQGALAVATGFASFPVVDFSRIAGGIAAGSAGVAVKVAAAAMADGGIVNRPTLALIGEAGPEAVVPLSRGRGMGGITIIQNIGGSVVAERQLRAMAVGAVARAGRGY